MSTCPPTFATLPAARRRPRTPRTPPLAPAAQTIPDGAIVLSDGDIWTRDGSRDPFVVQCLAGAAWLTQAGNAEDVILMPGDVHLTHGRGKVVVQPLGKDVALRVIC